MASPVGEVWPSSWTTDGTINGISLSNGSNTTSGAITVQATSPNQVLDTEVAIEFGYGSSAATGTVTISILKQSGSGYQGASDALVYSFTMTPTVSITNKIVFAVPGNECGGFKVFISNGSGNAFTASSLTLYYRQAPGSVG